MDSKLQIRNFLIHNSKGIMSIKVLLGCFPIIFGVSKTLFSKHQDQTFSSLFKHNLPGISSTQAQISWLTFEQISSNQFDSEINQFSKSNIYNSCIKRVDFYNDSVLIETNSNWHTKQKQVYIGAFNSLELNRINNKKQIGNNWYTVFSTNFKRNNFISKARNKKNWSVNSNYNTENTTPLYPAKLNSANKFKLSSNPIPFLDELPIKLNSSYISKQAFPKNVLETRVQANQLRFVEKSKPKQVKKINKQTFFGKNEIIPWNSASAETQGFKTKLSKFERFPDSNSLISSLLFDKFFILDKSKNKQKPQQVSFLFKKIFKDQSIENFPILKGINIFTAQAERNSTEKNLVDFPKTVFTKDRKSVV